MTISSEFWELTEKIAKHCDLPLIQDLFLPISKNKDLDCKQSNFGALSLDDDSIGIVYMNLTSEVKRKCMEYDFRTLIGTHPLSLAVEFLSSDDFLKGLGLGAVNAISQFLFKKSRFSFDFNEDSLGLLSLKPKDFIGMVGLFPPLVKKIESLGNRLVVIEKKANLIQKSENWEVSLDPRRLEFCNKILCTSTTILNESIDDILKYCTHAEKISVIGPTAGFPPDPLFLRGVNVVGGTFISKPKLFMKLIREGKRWGSATKKYCIMKEKYTGINTILKQLF